MLEGVYNLLCKNEELGQDALQVLGDIAEAEPKFFGKQFDLLFKTIV